MELLLHLGDVLLNTIGDLLPIVLIIFFFQVFIIRKAVPNIKKIVIGFVYVLVGLAFFLVGLQEALFPIGKLMVSQLTDPSFIFRGVGDVTTALEWHHYKWVFMFAAAIGFATAIAEPALMAIAIKANEVSGGSVGVWGLRIAVAIGVAIGLTIGSFRIVTGTPLHYYIIFGYVLVMIQTLVTPRTIIGLAYDSGGVATSTVTVPIVAALGLGLASTVPGRSPLMDGFGLIAFTCLCPIISVMAYAQISQWRAMRKKAGKK